MFQSLCYCWLLLLTVPPLRMKLTFSLRKQNENIILRKKTFYVSLLKTKIEKRLSKCFFQTLLDFIFWNRTTTVWTCNGSKCSQFLFLIFFLACIETLPSLHSLTSAFWDLWAWALWPLTPLGGTLSPLILWLRCSTYSLEHSWNGKKYLKALEKAPNEKCRRHMSTGSSNSFWAFQHLAYTYTSKKPRFPTSSKPKSSESSSKFGQANSKLSVSLQVHCLPLS